MRLRHLTSLIGALAIAVAMVLVVANAGSVFAGQNKVEICHINGQGEFHIISIAEPAYASHIAHGDKEVETYFIDADDDGFGTTSMTVEDCTPPEGFVADDTDCDDTNTAVNPGATEIERNGIDDDCNDETPDVPAVCPSTAAVITNQADADAHADCGTVDSIIIHQNTSPEPSGVPVTGLVMPNLKHVTNIVYFHQVPSLANVSLPSLQDVGGYVYMNGNPVLDSVDLGSLASTGEYFYFANNPNVSTVDLPNLLTAGGQVAFHINASLTSVDLGSLVSLTDLYFHQNPALTSVNSGSLVTAGGHVYFHQNTSLPSVDLHSLLSTERYVYFNGNTALNSVNLERLQRIGPLIPGNDAYLYLNLNPALNSFVVSDSDLMWIQDSLYFVAPLLNPCGLVPDWCPIVQGSVYVNGGNCGCL